jgi:abequosyltransferase
MTAFPTLSVCVPAYNRAKYLPALLDSALSQNYPCLEIVICEDMSPERDAIAHIARTYQANFRTPIRYFENKTTLGFDGNVRGLFERSRGDYCVMMGNDDLLCPGSLNKIGRLLAEHPEVGVVIRSYGWFRDDPEQVDQIVSYFPETLLFSPGENTIVTFFRRVGVLAGLVFRREDAVAIASDRFDGTLYYQMYVAAELLVKAYGLYIAEPIALCRENKPDFGRSNSEKGKFKPGEYTAAARITMIRGLLEIAKYEEAAHGNHIYRRILRDVGNYSYYFLSFQAEAPFSNFWQYYRELGKLGFNSNSFFHIYFWALAIAGKRVCESVIKLLRSTLKSTPRLGGIAVGVPAGGRTSGGIEESHGD